MSDGRRVWRQVESSTLSRAAALDALESLQRGRALLEARELRLLARIDELDRADHPDVRWDRESVSTILRCAPVTAHGRLAAASHLVAELPLTLEALEAGRITAGHARALQDAAFPLDPRLTGKLEARVLTGAEHTSVAEFRARCRRAVLAIDPHGAEARHQAAVATRSVEFRPDADGMSSTTARLATDVTARIRQHLDACVDEALAADPDDPRRRDAIRADVLADLLTGGECASVPGVRPIQVTVAFSTLLRVDDLPGEVDGEPVAASLARALANDPNAWWRPVLVDRDGHVEAVGARTYRPSAMLRRMVETHDRTCQFPGCRRRAVRCECDHVDPFDHDDPAAGGLTEFENLHCLCKRHHRLKHEAGWTVTRTNGITHWRSPQGRRYEKAFEPYLDPPDQWSDGTGTPPDHEPPPF